jgi:hypothetical protein
MRRQLSFPIFSDSHYEISLSSHCMGLLSNPPVCLTSKVIVCLPCTLCPCSIRSFLAYDILLVFIDLALWFLWSVLFTTASRTALRSTQPPSHWAPGALSVGIKRPGREADHSPPSSAEVKECVELYFHSHNTPSWRDAQLKHRDNFTFYLYCF